MAYGYIYKIVNKINGKVYIGQSTNIKERWKDHKNRLRKREHVNTYLQHAWDKYGEENFEFEVIDEADTKEELGIKEQYWIKEFGGCESDANYNLTEGGVRCRRSKESNLKTSISLKQYNKEHPENVEHHKEAMIQYYEDNPEARESVSKRMEEYWAEHPERHVEHSNFMKQYYVDHPEELEKKSEMMSGENNPMNNPEYRRKVSEKLSGEGNPMYGRTGENCPMYGNHMFAGENHPLYGKRGKDSPNFGKRRTEEQKQRMKDSWTDERRQRRRQQSKDYYTEEKRNEIGEKYSGAGNPRAVQVIHLNDMKIFGCIKDMAEAYGLNAGTIRNKLHNKIYTFKGHAFMKLDEWNALSIEEQEDKLRELKISLDTFK
mgnify:CR=1 FL=1